MKSNCCSSWSGCKDAHTSLKTKSHPTPRRHLPVVLLRAYFNTRKAAKVTVRCVATHLESLLLRRQELKISPGHPKCNPNSQFTTTNKFEQPLEVIKLHTEARMARDLCLCAGETQPSLQQLGKQEAGMEASAAESLTESQREAAEPQAWHLGGLRRWVKGTASRQISWQEHTLLLQESHSGTPVPP